MKITSRIKETSMIAPRDLEEDTIFDTCDICDDGLRNMVYEKCYIEDVDGTKWEGDACHACLCAVSYGDD